MKAEVNAFESRGDRASALSQIARAGTVVARAPQLPDRIVESRERSAELMLSRQRYFTCTHWMA